jgi:hypothetical protein
VRPHEPDEGNAVDRPYDGPDNYGEQGKPVASTFGVLPGLLGVEHGYIDETLQGNVATDWSGLIRKMVNVCHGESPSL